MVTNLKTIAMLCLALQLIVSCKPSRILKITKGKSVPITLRYNIPFKLGDTVWVSYECDISDLTNDDRDLPKNNFNKYTATMSSSFSYLSSENKIISENIGDYVKITNSFPNFQIMYYNNLSQVFEAKFGFVPNKRGSYSYQISAILLQPDNNYTDYWSLDTYFVGEDPAGNVIKRDFEVE